MKFAYSVQNKDGEKENGVIDSDSQENAFRELENKGYLVTEIANIKQSPHAQKELVFFGKVSIKDKIFFTKYLSTMIKAGIPILESLIVIEKQSKGYLKNILIDIVSEVEKGKNFSQALMAFPKVFDPLFINMIKVGEASGTLEKSLFYLSVQLEKDFSMQSKVKNATIYPTLVLMVALVMGIGLSYFILPKLSSLFSVFGSNMPFATKVLMGFSQSLVNYGLWYLVGTIILVIFIIFYATSPIFRPIRTTLILYTPIFGTLSKNFNLARFSLTLGTLLKSGVSMSESLQIIKVSLDSYPYQKELGQICSIVDTQGKTIAGAMEMVDPKEQLFSATTREMIRIGEKSGKLDENLLYLANFYEQEVDNTSKNLATVLEPVLLVIIGIVVAFIAIAIISPIYQLLGSIHR